MEFQHIPVLFGETIDSLDVQPDGIYVDCTAGGGNHSAAVLERLGPDGRLVCLDRDPDAIAAVTARFAGDERVTVIHTPYSAIADVLDGLGIPAVNGILMDIGVSSHQVDTAERGFSFHKDAPLDMRMSQEGVTAADLCASMTWQQLAEIFSRYGEHDIPTGRNHFRRGAGSRQAGRTSRTQGFSGAAHCRQRRIGRTGTRLAGRI